MHRRAYLATLGSVGTLAVAGCGGSSGDTDSGRNRTESANEESTTAASATAPSTVNGETTVASETTTDGTTTAEKRRETTAETTTAAGERSSTTPIDGTPSNQRYDRRRVTFVDESGTQLGSVRVWIADTAEKRYTGLSETESLPNGTGMLFTYDEASEHTYVMRRMDYPLDIVFIGADGRINGIESAPAPGPDQNGNDIRRTGRGQYVLEVPRGWMAEQGIEVGDRTNLGELEVTATSLGPSGSSTSE